MKKVSVGSELQTVEDLKSAPALQKAVPFHEALLPMVTSTTQPTLNISATAINENYTQESEPVRCKSVDSQNTSEHKNFVVVDVKF